MRIAEGWRLVRSFGDWQALSSISASHGQRDLLRQHPAVRAWASAQWPHVVAALSTMARPISGMWFDKLPEANWHVPWHQDVHVPINPFIALGWGPWTNKENLPMVIPPEPWLSRRVALRLHVDVCGAEHGPLQIIPYSHRYGRLTPTHLDELVRQGPIVTIHANPGDVLILHPLLLHRSAAATNPSHRRVVQVEWCDAPLPPGEIWLDANL